MFLIVAEGLTGLMNKAVATGLFHGYKVSNTILFHTLQFADDTIIVGEGNWDNLWSIKTVLRSFELVSGLKVNFFKSKLYGINLDDIFLRASSSFLHCGVDHLPFRFLGIPVGANPRRKATWSPILDVMKKRLSIWNGRHLSIGGRVTLIKSVLSSLPLYFFSFFKAPACVIKELVCIQRQFLWSGGLDSNKMCWVSWDQICQPKENGGLGIKNLELFNSSLLCKWKWRCLNDTESPWYDLLRFRYGSLVANFLYGEGRDNLKHASIWWRDLWCLGGMDNANWFGNNVSSILGDGNDISFWKDQWIGTASLRVMFPSLYVKSTLPDGHFSTMGMWERDTWKWKFEWTTELSDIESETVHDLLLILDQVRPSRETRDRRRWKPHKDGFFTVNTAYTALLPRTGECNIEPITANALKLLWLNNVPSKVSIFGWRLLLGKLPTREALYNKGVITNNHERSCVFCFNVAEDIPHMFFNCNVTKQIWCKIFKWMGTRFCSATDVPNHLIQFGVLITGSNNERFRHIIWLATTWSIWRMRNNIIFRGDFVNVSSLVDQIIYIAWFWFIGRSRNIDNVAFIDWCNNPLACFRCF
ncbi:unnamed protein product [Trifolium pratense]|uniref:Uncharacterized protein n=1 Tax=Trifolium pratense TaxID=57577 RepID=A0ACB0IRQ6_TRIPR|nr:unnamed protein product [Trifolium pratense]